MAGPGRVIVVFPCNPDERWIGWVEASSEIVTVSSACFKGGACFQGPYRSSAVCGIGDSLTRHSKARIAAGRGRIGRETENDVQVSSVVSSKRGIEVVVALCTYVKILSYQVRVRSCVDLDKTEACVYLGVAGRGAGVIESKPKLSV